MKKLAVFVSGGGTDMQSVIDAIKSGYIVGAEIALVISNKADAYALTRATNEGIKSAVFKKSDYSSLTAMYEEVILLLNKEKIDLVVLAGYLLILTPNILRAYEHRIINIHPALIPSYCGKGYYGMRVHEAVVAAGESFSGATVHFVDENADTGEIIAQERVPVYPTDTAETLAARVLTLEHTLLPKTIKKLIEEELI